MANLQDLLKPLPKPWLNVNFNSVTTKQLDADIANITDLEVNDLVSDLLTLNNQVGVPNAPVNATSFFSSGQGNLSQTDEFGATVTYATTSFVGAYLPLDGSQSMTGNIDMGTNNLINANSLVINEVVPANPPAGQIAIYSQFDGLNSLDSLGNVRQYLNGGDPVVSVNPVSAVVGDIPVFSNVNGKEVTDSGVLLSNLASKVQVNGSENQVESLAPGGQRDLWKQSNSSGSYWPSYSSFFDIIWASGGAPGGQYSTDGGANFLNCVFDIAPTDDVVFGTNNTNLVVGFSYSGQYYTSADGINFTLQGTSLTIKPESNKIMFFNNLFIFSDYNTPNMSIATSPDGITWTSRSATVIAENFDVSDSMIVGVGYTSPFMLYSLDGITWVNSPSVLEVSLAVGYSPDKKQWGILSRLTNNVYSSSDGINFSLTGASGPNFCWSMIWVSKYSRWYVGAGDVDGNMSLWSTLDLSQSFVDTHLDGSQKDPVGQDEPIFYMPSRDSFAMGSYTGNPILEYSVARNYDIKAVSDNIRVRNLPVQVSNYSSYASVNVNNTVVETSIVSGSALGSLELQASQPLGMYMKIFLFMIVNSALGDTLTINLKTQSGTISSNGLSIPGAVGNQLIAMKFYLTLQSTNILCNVEANATNPLMNSSSLAYNKAIKNTLSLTAQWGANVNSLEVNQLIVETGFRNGE